jgi:predicted RNase H-like HicB family nuclease
MTLKVVIHKETDGYWAEVPALKGCYSQGNTLKEVKANIGEAIQGYLETVQEEFMEGMNRSRAKKKPQLFEVEV